MENRMITSIIIPARLESTRLPHKMLLNETGKPLIWYSIENAMRSKLAQNAIVATDSHEIIEAILECADDEITQWQLSEYNNLSFGLHIIQTPQMNSGTERVMWAAKTLRDNGIYDSISGKHININSDLIINLQADEPELNSEYIDLLIDTMSDFTSTDGRNSELIATAKNGIGTLASFSEPNADRNMVKVVVDNEWNAMYFSRSPIPYGGSNLIHTGIYGYNYETLMSLGNKIEPVQSLASENLEQLAWLQNGHKIKVILVNQRPVGIDTREDYDMFVERMKIQK